MDLAEGREIECSDIIEFKEFLDNRKLNSIIVSPRDLKIVDRGKRLYLNIFGNTNGIPENENIPLRRSFLYKLLNWYKFPLRQLNYLNIETISAVCNDYLLAISSPKVKIVFENDEALTLTSLQYSGFSDKDILEVLGNMKISKISRDDFVTRYYFEIDYRTEPIPGDETGFGFNIINSETGFWALSYVNYVIRYSCSNGAVIKLEDNSDKVYHYNNDKMVFEKYLMKQIDRTKSLNYKIKERIRISGELKIGKRIKSVQNRLDFITGSNARIDLFNNDDNELTVYEVVNIITENAKKYSPYSRIRLEEFAGSLITEEINFN